ncbi:armadillo-type protein [Mycena alexandri]|uniref:Armadillo-type protein n=1 Tax=Mycena alexandri TaxID=1745969 RepID=A0AAD6WW23_9AGAR|nr:armadillo-type protein [Mycena alexandri]
MAPLRRWATRESVLSWWSDSNSLGATIPLHTMAKPLMKHLYHRQAAGIILNSTPLSVDKLEVLTTYLNFKEISSSTKVLVLDHLRLRAWQSEEEANMIVGANTLDYVDELLQSSNPDVLLFTCRLLRNLVYYESLKPAVTESDSCSRLVSLLCHPSTRVQEEAVNALACISAGSYNSASCVVRANALDPVLQLLASQNFGVRLHTCWMLGNIARHSAFNRTVLELDSVARLMSLLQPTNWRISDGTRRELRWLNLAARDISMAHRNVVYALACISAGSEYGVRSLVKANILVQLPPLMESPNPDVVRLACKMLGEIAQHKAFTSAVLELRPLTRLVSLLKDSSPGIRQEAAFAVRCIIGLPNEKTVGVHTTAITHEPRILATSIPSTGIWEHFRRSYKPRKSLLGELVDVDEYSCHSSPRITGTSIGPPAW